MPLSVSGWFRLLCLGVKKVWGMPACVCEVTGSNQMPGGFNKRECFRCCKIPSFLKGYKSSLVAEILLFIVSLFTLFSFFLFFFLLEKVFDSILSLCLVFFLHSMSEQLPVVSEIPRSLCRVSAGATHRSCWFQLAPQAAVNWTCCPSTDVWSSFFCGITIAVVGQAFHLFGRSHLNFWLGKMLQVVALICMSSYSK